MILILWSPDTPCLVFSNVYVLTCTHKHTRAETDTRLLSNVAVLFSVPLQRAMQAS